ARSEALLILPGLALCELGVVALTPGMLSVAGKLAPRLGVSFRIALRDASRNRSAAVPALAAVLAATTASIAIAIYVSSVSAKDRLTYQPQLPTHMAIVQVPPDNPEVATLASQALRSNLDTDRVDVLSSANCQQSNCVGLNVLRPPRNQCPDGQVDPSDPRCDFGGGGYAAFDGLVLDPADLSTVMTSVKPADVAALRAGKLLLGNPLDLAAPGQVTVERPTLGSSSPTEPAQSTLAAAVAASSSQFHFQFILTPATAAKLHLKPEPVYVLARLSQQPSDRQ
ncbi:MAG: hypothetical protein M3Y89_07855, partial [Actinomycetota bacterium]|nr:hypothetical protein [Actinomycetota bacterium]